ncbi:MAG: response regulator [Chitinophagaceae bacterium]|nr:MAG: response regulator [Chitinophagaceae bacterium]
MTRSLPPKSLFLYADDDPDDRQLLMEIFSDYSASVELLTFPDALLLLEYLQSLQPLQPQPALIILDQNMPGLTGINAIPYLRALSHIEEVPMVIFTTSSQPHEAARARQLGAGFVTKPLTAAQVQQIVDQLLDFCADDVKERVNRMRGK